MPEPGMLTTAAEERETRERRDQLRLDELAAFVARVRRCEDYRMAETTFPAMLSRLAQAVGCAQRLRAELREERGKE